MTEHTQKCLELQKKYELARTIWASTHPNYCRECSGFGEYSYTENQSPIGSGCNWPMTETDICSHCIEDGLCPHCRNQLFFPGATENDYDKCNCTHCGWDDTKLGKDGCPPEFEGPCECEWKEAEKYRKQVLNELLYGSIPEDEMVVNKPRREEVEECNIEDDPDDGREISSGPLDAEDMGYNSWLNEDFTR